MVFVAGQYSSQSELGWHHLASKCLSRNTSPISSSVCRERLLGREDRAGRVDVPSQREGSGGECRDGQEEGHPGVIKSLCGTLVMTPAITHTQLHPRTGLRQAGERGGAGGEVFTDKLSPFAATCVRAAITR